LTARRFRLRPKRLERPQVFRYTTTCLIYLSFGVLMGYAETNPTAQAQVAALRQKLQMLGWEEGRNIRVDVRFPGTDGGRVRAMLMELMSLTPDVLVSNINFVTAVVQAEGRD
jgi:putative tryptophan/tyrosine transport system substrate-binding protein